jgi:dolichol-phosphate mannosyltransferase
MSDEVEVAVAETRALHLRVRAGLRRPHNWLQLVKFCAVGASGYVVNLCVFALCVEAIGLHHLVGATVAFVLLVAVVGLPKVLSQAIAVIAATPLNFIGNKMWSFRIELSRD